MSGATFLGAFFIATDYVTSPVSKTGQLIFAPASEYSPGLFVPLQAIRKAWLSRYC